jgi:hypothetical protein
MSWCSSSIVLRRRTSSGASNIDHAWHSSLSRGSGASLRHLICVPGRDAADALHLAGCGRWAALSMAITDDSPDVRSVLETVLRSSYQQPNPSHGHPAATYRVSQ